MFSELSRRHHTNSMCVSTVDSVIIHACVEGRHCSVQSYKKPVCFFCCEPGEKYSVTHIIPVPPQDPGVGFLLGSLSGVLDAPPVFVVASVCAVFFAASLASASASSIFCCDAEETQLHTAHLFSLSKKKCGSKSGRSLIRSDRVRSVVNTRIVRHFP